VVTNLTTNSPVRYLNKAERTGSLVVTYSDTTKTAKLSVYGIAQLLTRFCRKEKDLLALHSFGLSRSARNSVAQAAKRSTNSSNTTRSSFPPLSKRRTTTNMIGAILARYRQLPAGTCSLPAAEPSSPLYLLNTPPHSVRAD
jgi:hypothetical protein